jgi:hypothetical protein
VNGKSGSPVIPFPKIISTHTSVVASSTKETHCLKENLDHKIEHEILINHQLNLSKDKFKH